MLQPRESRLLWRRRKRRHSMEGLCCSRIYSTLIIIGCLTSLPQGLTQHNDDIYIVKPTPALRFGKEELTTVLLVNNENHGRFINVRPEVGLLTSTARTFIQEGVTTEYATQVVGTTLDNGRVYAQYLKKSSRVLYDGGSAMPSVVTSWVGESLHSEAVFLPQSHNDLFDADQPDWQAIDDRLLGDRRHHDDFVGNTDYVGLRSKSSSATSSQSEIKSLGITSSLGYTTNSKSSYDFVTHLGENARKVAANKVLPIGDLPTYTIKQNYEPSAYLTSNDDVGLEEDNDEEAFGRNPKLIYKKLMQNHVRSENESASVLQAPKPLIPFSRHFATVTYYGFADFTTVVGDSVIVFSPSTSTQNMNYQAQVTSIKGEATLGAGSPQSITKVPITIAQDIIEPTIAQQPSIKTSLDAASATVMEMDTGLDETSSTSSSTTTVITTSSEKTDAKQESVTLLETSEVVVHPTQSEMSSIESTSKTAPVMLSRPSNEEILRIYNALANANVEADKVQIQSTAALNTTIITDATSADDEVQLKTSNVEIFGGATTIFFEDDPFANFVDASKTQTSTNLDSTIATQNMSTSLGKSSTFSLKESTEVPTIEVTTEESKSETTTDAALTSSEIILDTEVENIITTPVPNTKHSNQDENSPADMLPNVLIKEIDPNNEEVPQDCISTSQVFLTQLPKTVTQTETVVITINESELRTEIKQQIQPTFEIKEATKYYCIQASQVQANQIESPLVKQTISALENKDQHLAPVDVTEVNEEDVTETFVWTTTEETLFTDKTEQPDEDEKKQDISKPTGLATSAELEVDENEQEDDGDEEASGQPDDEEEEDDEEIELIYKTLYTTYTYLTTFFHDESTSISSHTEVVTNVMTSTLGISSTKESTSTYIIANVDDNEINPTGSLAVTTQMETTKRYVVPSEVESFIRTDEIETDADIVDNSYVSSKSSESLTTFYTTYTYYTTIFAEGETDIMSHTEIITNVKKSATSATSEAEKIMPTISSYSAAANEENIATTIYQGEEELIREIESRSMSRSATLAANDKALLPDIPELGDLSAITLITDVRSSSSPGDKQIINKISAPATISNDTVLPQQQSILEDQISSESNTDTDEIIPSATLLLQTSFTTFTYYTTMYSGDETNVISRLETMTNTVTETLKPSKKIDLKDASLPITYFTTFTYWTKLAKEGQITTLSREEIISNVIVPTMVQPETQETHTQMESLENTKNKDSDVVANIVTETILTEETTSNEVHDENVLNQAHLSELTTNMSAGQHTTNILEPTTYYTTYTYYTTSYEADKTITDSRFETATNIVTPTVTLSNTKERDEDSAKLEKPIYSSATPAQSQINVSDASTSELVLYDFKKIIDADGISTIFFTTEIKPTLNSDGVLTEVISSTSSLLINEEKRSIQATEAMESSVNSLGVEGQMQKQYKTGLVRLIEGTRIANKTTTLYQSKVIGTVIDQRYAQIIESTSSFIFEKTRAPEDSNSMNVEIMPTSSSDVQNIQATQQVSLESSISLPKVEGSITETSLEQDIDSSTKPAEEVDEENYSKTDEKLRFPFQTKKPPFISPLKPFSNRNRPQFAPKKNSSATIITRSDFTPTITATPALKTISRFSSTRRGSASSNSISFASSSRRFGRPSKSSIAGSGLQVASTVGQAASRNRFASSSSARGSFASSSRRLGGSSNTIRPSFSRPSLFSSGFSGNSRLRVRPTSTADIGEVSSAIDIATSVPLNSQEDGGGVSQNQYDLEDDEENATESNRKQNNPLLRLRRPLNRPQGFTPARPQINSPNNAVSLRRNPLINRGRSSNVATLTSTTTTTTAKPKPRTFQPPLIAQNRIRPTNSLFPPRNIFGVQKAAVTTEENKDLSEEDTNENNDDSEYEDDDDEELEGEDEEESNRRRRRSHNNTELVEKHKLRNKREADSAQQNRSNFRNRFRRPKLASHAQAESKSSEDEASEAKEPVTTGIPASTTATQRTRTRFGARYPQHSSSSTTSATTSSASSNHKAIRPTRPTSNGRAQFTLRDKDSSAMSTTQKGLTTAKRPAFRRPQPGGTHGTRRLPSSTAPSSSSSSSSGKRRLKSFTNNDATTTSRNSVTGRSRSSSTTSGRSRVSSPSRDSNIGGRNRARNNHNYNSNNNNNNEPLIIDNSGTITVTHVIPTEVTIPVVNGKVTEYKQVVTAKTSTEILEPQQYTTTIAANGLPQLALTREDSSVNYNGATEVTQYVLHETPTTTITFTPTTIRGRKTSFSHVLPSTVYSVEQVVSTVQPQISANAPLANILLSQLLLGNVGLQAGNPLLGALGGALSQPGVGLGTAVGPAQPATPVTEYKTHASTYVTTVVEGQSTVLPITFQGKKILTTIFDTTAQTITATEFITDTIVTTPTALVQPQPAVNSLLLQQLLLQQHLQQQQQQLQQPTPDPSYPLNAILNSVPPQFLLGGDNLQELEASNNIRGSGQSDLLNDDDDFTVGSSVDLDDIALQAQAQTHKTGRKKTRKNGKNHKRKQNNNVEAHGAVESSVITLYVSGRRPGEFSTVLSTVQVRPDSTQYKRHAHTIDTETDYLNDGSELVNEYLALPPEIILLDGKDKHENEVVYENEGVATQSLESIVGDVSLWYSTQTTTSITTSTNDMSKVSATEIITDQRYDMAESPRLNVDTHVANSSSNEYFFV
ncbi:serine-rich adhesin for platelets [Calliphora vicina]|uniref:serine-rich adhesin for platelets n=1 Tax=Calliphora vicina TaxID=7373 RepID=UPI00325A7BCA